jgi:hypothetical protein
MTNYLIFITSFVAILSTIVAYFATKIATIKTNLVTNKTKECNILKQNCENTIQDLMLNHKIVTNLLKQDFEDKVKLLQNNTTLISNNIFAQDFISLTLFKFDSNFEPSFDNPPHIEQIETKYGKNVLSISVSNPDVDVEQIESILCNKLAEYLIANKFVTNKINFNDNIVTFCLNFYSKI